MFYFRHTAVDIELLKPKKLEKLSQSPPVSPPVIYNKGSVLEPPKQQSAVIVKSSVPSLRNLSENCLSVEKVAKIRDVVRGRMLLQSKSLTVESGVNSNSGSCSNSNSNSNSRPIYPNCTFSPYGSPLGSPRCNRKRQPLKESRRVSIEKSGMYIQLNQYKLMDAIGQVSCKIDTFFSIGFSTVLFVTGFIWYCKTRLQRRG